MSKKWTVAAVLALCAMGTAVVAETAASSGKMLRMKPGSSVFTILDTTGVRPLAGSELAVRDMQDGSTVVGAVANDAGRVAVELPEGRFILSVDKMNLSIMDVSMEAQHTECRIVMPAQEMLVGGQQDDEDDDLAGVPPQTLGSRMMTPVIIGGAVVLVGGIAYAIDEHSGSGSRAGAVVEGEPDTITRRTTRTVVGPTPTPIPIPPPPTN